MPNSLLAGLVSERDKQESRACMTSQLPGASTGHPTHDKVMSKRTVKQGFRTQGAPQTFSSIYPKTRICLSYYFVPFTNSPDINRGLSPTTFLWRKSTLVLQLISLLDMRGIFQIKPPLLAFQLAWQVYPDSCSCAYDCSQPPNCERHGKPKTQSLSKS